MGDIELEIFAQRLRELRTSLGMTQKDFANELNITASALSSYEKNNINPSISIAKRIAEKYHVSIDWLCGLSDKMTYNNKIESYTDLYKILFEIESSEHLEFCTVTTTINCGIIDTYPEYREMDIQAIYFEDSNIISFMDEWQKMKVLHDSNTIDDDVYNLWKEKILLKSQTYKRDKSN